MTDLNLLQYLFDVQGYLVIENALSPAELAQFNRLLDGQQLPEPGHTQRFGSAPDGSGFLAWGQPFVNLLDHPRIMPILRFRLGDCFRLDRIYGMCMSQGMGQGRLHADYGATANNARTQQGEYVPFRDDQIYNGFVVVTWCLSDSGPGMGGFCCIPGSHKSNYKLPQQIDEAPDEAACVIIPRRPPARQSCSPRHSRTVRPPGKPSTSGVRYSTNTVCRTWLGLRAASNRPPTPLSRRANRSYSATRPTRIHTSLLSSRNRWQPERACTATDPKEQPERRPRAIPAYPSFNASSLDGGIVSPSGRSICCQ